MTGKPHTLNAFGSRLVAYLGEDGQVHILDSYCPHMGADLSRGQVRGNSVVCPWLGIASSYQSGSFDATGLDPASVDGAFSIDVIWAIPDKQAGFAETARILRPGAKFVFTDWERDLSPPGYPAPVSDYRPLLAATGFEVERRQLWPHADSLRRAFYEKMLARQGELMRELDEKTAESNLREARAWLGLLDGVDYMQHSRRVLIAARKLPEG